ncbi:hypothetical protein SBRCBS47491_005910 [Sporothrix bragantina]|uniref:Zn(2)-C6 fungal-type domain-containing protein n=1 Tax=Sporothrix bragantina TaxID=671064 RepID=A0ABP0C0H5_9PEZI
MSRHIKSRSGCRVCKAKRLKCDETTPACRNCVNRGIACPGYRQVLRWSTKYENPVPKPAGEKKTGKGKQLAGEATLIPEFSQLASAASRSIKPGGSGSTDDVPTASASTASTTTKTTKVSAPPAPPIPPVPPSINTPIVFEPVVVKTESASLPRQQLAQVPQAPPAPSHSMPISSHSPAASSTSSSASSSSYGRHDTPVVPVLAADTHDTTPDPFSFTYQPTASSTATTTSSIIASTAPTTASAPSRQDWQLALYSEQEHDDDEEDEVSFTLELWQPERFQYYGRQQNSHHQHQQQLQILHPTRGLALPGTSLVELWFSSVCGMWAAFDSPANPFRQLCSRLWSSNEAVFFSLQTMAAASLPKRPPSVSEIVAVAPQMSTHALIRELQDLFGPGGEPTRGPGGRVDAQHHQTADHSQGHSKFPAGLLTSLFCMSSSLSWIDARQLGIQYLRNARSVIELLDLRASQLSADDRELLEFFRGCLLYEEMLRSIVTDDQEDIQALLDWSPDKSSHSQKGDGKKVDLDLHAWAGVPIVLIGLFGKVMALCRRSRKAWRTTGRATYQLLYQAMQDIQEGQALEEMLLSIDIPLSGEGQNGKGEALTTHIYKAAEAFRLSSLLQLYQTFPDLVSQRQQARAGALTGLPGAAGPPSGAATGAWLMSLVLHIVDLLGEIPADSPMRCLQPLLCLCAGSALRIEDDLPQAASDFMMGAGSAVDLVGSSRLRSTSATSTTSTTDPLLDFSFSGGLVGPGSTSVHMARDALRVRLGKLERNLPRRPITVARRLLETVWLTYDTEAPPNRSHWLDIMSETNFESVFG